VLDLFPKWHFPKGHFAVQNIICGARVLIQQGILSTDILPTLLIGQYFKTFFKHLEKLN
jgi:hypothetical protein